MRTKPWPLVVLAFCYLVSPLANTLMGAHLMKLPYGAYLSTLVQHSTWMALFVTFLLYPLAGLAIFAVKRWSYPVYLAVMLITLYLNYRDWRIHHQSISLPLFVLTTTLNVGLVSYFLLPAVRTPYFDRRLRWWEAKPRYLVSAPALLRYEGRAVKGTVLNISEGGVFLKCGKRIKRRDDTVLEFTIAGHALSAPVTVKYHLQAQRGYGLEFKHTKETHRSISTMIAELKHQGAKERNEKPEWKRDLKNWALTALTTGKGLVPEIAGPPAKKAEPAPTQESDKRQAA